MVAIAILLGFTMLGFAIVGATIGALMVRRRIKPPVGTLRIDTSDPDGPFMFLELAVDPSFVMKEEYVNLKVDVRNYISQK